MPPAAQEAIAKIVRMTEEGFYRKLEEERYNRETLNEGVPPRPAEVLEQPDVGTIQNAPAPQFSPEEIARQTEEARRFLLENVGRLASAAEEIRAALDTNVKQARLLGVTWADIARSVGVTPQSAYRRWDPEGKRKDRDYRRKIRNPSEPDQGPGGKPAQ